MSLQVVNFWVVVRLILVRTEGSPPEWVTFRKQYASLVLPREGERLVLDAAMDPYRVDFVAHDFIKNDIYVWLKDEKYGPEDHEDHGGWDPASYWEALGFDYLESRASKP